MKLKDFISATLEEFKEIEGPVEMVVCIDHEMNVVNENWNQVKFKVQRKK